MAKKAQPVEGNEAKKRNRKVQPVALVVISAPEGSDLAGGQKVEDDSIHDLASAGRFVRDNNLSGVFEVVRVLGTITSEPTTKQRVTVQ
jgi:hypothetical protein